VEETDAPDDDGSDKLADESATLMCGKAEIEKCIETLLRGGHDDDEATVSATTKAFE